MSLVVEREKIEALEVSLNCDMTERHGKVVDRVLQDHVNVQRWITQWSHQGGTYDLILVRSTPDRL